MLKNYFKIAWRKISRHKVYTIINVLGLALGICACLVIYLITHFELSYDTFHPDKDRIYRVVAEFQRKDEKQKWGFILSPLPMAMRNELSGFEKVAGFYNYYAKVAIPNGKKKAKIFNAAKFEQASNIIVAEPEYFDIFQYEWLAGNARTALKEPNKVVLSETEVRKYFGTEQLDKIIGRQIIYDDSLYLTVSGIVKDWNKNTDFGFTDFISFNTVQHSFLKYFIDMDAWGMWNNHSQGFVKLAKGTTLARVEKQFSPFLKKHILRDPSDESTFQLGLQPLSDIHFNEAYRDSYSRKVNISMLYGLVGVALFILIIAAINFINLSTAQSIQRAKEVGIRKVLGSNRTNIIFQFLSETFILTLLAAILSLLITNPVISAMQMFIPKGVTLDLYKPTTLIFLILIITITTLLAGFYPAKFLSSYQPALSLKGPRAHKQNQKNYLQKTLIIFQFTVSLIFIIGTIILSRQMHFILNKDLGFTKDAIISMYTSYNYPPDKEKLLAEKIKQLPGVQLVSMHMETPAAKEHSGTDIIYKGKEVMKANASFEMCDENYVPLFGLKIIAGRNLLPSDTIREFLLNETCARALGFREPEDAVGKQVEIGMNNAKGPIVGVIRDFHSQSLHESIAPFFISSFLQGERDISVKMSTNGKEVSHFKTVLAKIQKQWKEIYPDEEFEYSFFDDTVAKLYDKEQKTSMLMNIAMVIAIFISCMGLFGLAMFTAERRTKEIGIRKVLGASVANITTLLSKDFVILVIIALAIASPIAWYFMNRWLQDFAYRIHISGWVFVLAGSGAILIALFTVSFQAIKAAVANPVNSLRSE